MTVCCLNKPIFFFRGLFVFIGFSTLFLSCKNKDGIGLELQDPAEGINTIQTDTFSLFTTTVKEDSLRTDNLSYNLLGSMNDPLLGYTSATVFTEPRLLEEGTGFSYGASPQIDSVVLSLKYTSPESFYGNLNTMQTIKVHQLNMRIRPDQDYYSNAKITYDPIECGSWTGKFNLTDSIGSSPKKAPQLRIHLNSQFADKLKNADQSNNEAFLEAIKGVAILSLTPQSAGEGAIVYLNLKAAETNITVYYNDTLSHTYPINDRSTRFNTYAHSYTGSAAAGYVNSAHNADTGFVQTLQGLKLKISIPHLFNLVKTDAVAINSAEIVFSALDGTFNDPYGLPGRMLLVQPDENGRNTFILDQLPAEALLYGGSLNKDTHEYKFRITRHLQDLLNIYRRTGIDNNRGLYLLIPTDNPVSASRMVVDTRKQSAKKIRLVLTYTIAK